MLSAYFFPFLEENNAQIILNCICSLQTYASLYVYMHASHTPLLQNIALLPFKATAHNL
jgi:hypothetical protein